MFTLSTSSNYPTMQQGYPDPNFENTENTRYKLIEMPDSSQDSQRDQNLQYHNYPKDETSFTLPQYTHALKRQGDGIKQQTKANETLSIPKMKYIEESLPMKNLPISERDSVYKAIYEQFPYVMTKTHINGKFSIYKAVVKCLLCSAGMRYVIAITLNDTSPIGKKVSLQNLPWLSFQTRYTEYDDEIKLYNLLTFDYNRLDNTILHDRITLTRQLKNSILYDCDNLPLTVEILKNKEDEIFADQGTILSALETFQCLLQFR